jgi:hypothetical protein
VVPFDKWLRFGLWCLTSLSAIFQLYRSGQLILTRRVSLVEQELLTLPKPLSSPPVFSEVRVQILCFVDRCLSFCTFSFGHCVVCSSSIYGFWLHLWYLQTLLVLVEETGGNHRPVASNWQTLSHTVVSSTSRHELESNSQI